MAVRPIDGTWSKFVWNLGEKSESLARKFREGKACLRDLRLAVDAQPALIPPNKLKRAGLYGKYIVLKNEDGSLVTNCFVLRPEKDPAAVTALRAYAAATDNAELADDIINWVGAELPEPPGKEKNR